MDSKPTSAVRPSLADMPFSKMLDVDRELAELRREYDCKPSEERRNAADWQYDSAGATDIFDQALVNTVLWATHRARGSVTLPRWPSIPITDPPF